MAEPSASALRLIPDAPITSANYDRLDRKAFVRSFAEAVKAVSDTDSVVLALAGPWGSGKSSLLNLIAGELVASSPDHPPLIMRFNPWWFTGTEQLVPAFLQQLAAVVSRPDAVETFGGAASALDALAKAIVDPGKLVATEDVASRDIETLRDNVSQVFRKSKRRVLIFMDDIDRLSPEEMTQLLLIVRAIADFPNTTYVLAFDYEVVVESIASKLGIDGRTYLEKVVLLQIDVPMPGRMALEQMVVGQLESIVPAAKTLDLATQRHFRLLFEGGVKHFLATPRACTRFLNMVRFTYPSATEQVYFPDLIGIACLMSFSSQAIQAIRTSSEAFAGHCDPSGKGWMRIREFHTRWLEQIPRRDRPAVESMIRLLFPKVAWALSGPLCGEEFIDIWDQQKRVCSVKHFESYFRLGLSAGEAAEHKSQNLLGLLDGATSFARALQRFGPLDDETNTQQVGELLDQAGDFVKEQATSEQAYALFEAIMQRGDDIAVISPPDAGHLLKIDNIHRVVSVLVSCLLRIDQPQRRRDVLLATASQDAGLLTTAELLDVLEYRCDVFADGKNPPTIESNTAFLMEVLRVLDKRLEEASVDGSLDEHPLYMKIVQRWFQFGRKATAQKWIREQCASDEQFVDALTQGTSPQIDESAECMPSIPRELLIELFRRKELRRRCQSILDESPEWLQPHGEQVLISLLNRL